MTDVEMTVDRFVELLKAAKITKDDFSGENNRMRSLIVLGPVVLNGDDLTTPWLLFQNAEQAGVVTEYAKEIVDQLPEEY